MTETQVKEFYERFSTEKLKEEIARCRTNGDLFFANIAESILKERGE